MTTSVGLIAGQGELPCELARSARSRGRRVVGVGLRELASPQLAACTDEHHALYLGELGAMLDCLRGAGVEEVVLAGKVPKTFLWERPDAVRPDPRAASALASAPDRADDSLMGAVVAALEQEGLRVLAQAEMAPELVAPEGTLGAHKLSPEQWADVAFGFPIARALGAVDVGQSVVVQGRAVLALEAIEGTDAAIRRGCGLGEAGACVVKLAKPSQDPRFDVPVVGPETVRVLAAGRGAVLAVEAGATLLVDRAALVREADSAGIALVGVSEASLAAGAAP